jgi:hypothetical protein
MIRLVLRPTHTHTVSNQLLVGSYNCRAPVNGCLYKPILAEAMALLGIIGTFYIRLAYVPTCSGVPTYQNKLLLVRAVSVNFPVLYLRLNSKLNWLANAVSCAVMIKLLVQAV